jgi:hypothetical protein
VGTVIGAVTNNLLYGVVAGVVIGMLNLGGFTLKAIGISGIPENRIRSLLHSGGSLDESA